MIQVGVRQFRNDFTHYLRLVQQGQPVIVTSRNRPIAVLVKPDCTSARTEEEVVAALVAEGKLLPAAEPGAFERFKPVRVKGKPVSRMIIEDRR